MPDLAPRSGGSAPYGDIDKEAFRAASEAAGRFFEDTDSWPALARDVLRAYFSTATNGAKGLAPEAHKQQEQSSRTQQAEAREKGLREALTLLAERVERDLHEPDKLLCNVQSARQALHPLQTEGEG